ncbi:hypothetical protein EGR_08547 [Echinococcus granulosus]|uniref:Uncharacterized protein n=1 Tax=Echinococcus granulosus TaxID=6210 RepID=W6U892_ECHGR|nr:hypothetical protein EGR_08547 [Echinococcus granulosus]EUB56581.1 hypothetical protein EGR_08547 [Echinococcus granulosus]
MLWYFINEEEFFFELRCQLLHESECFKKSLQIFDFSYFKTDFFKLFESESDGHQREETLDCFCLVEVHQTKPNRSDIDMYSKNK